MTTLLWCLHRTTPKEIQGIWILLINQCANKFMLHLLWGKLQLQPFSTEFSNQTSIHASELSCMIHPSIYLLKHFRVVGVWNFSQEILGEST